MQTSCHWLRPAGRLALRPASRSRVASKAATHEVKREAARLPQRGPYFPWVPRPVKESSAAESDAHRPPLPRFQPHPEKEAKKPRSHHRSRFAVPCLPRTPISPPSPVTPGHRLPSPPLSTQLSSYPPPRILCVSLAYLPPLRCNPTADPGSTRKCPRILVSSAWSLLGCTKFGLFRWGAPIFSATAFICMFLGWVCATDLSRPPHMLIR